MNSDELKNLDLLSGYTTTPNSPTVADRKILELLREIAYQLAKLNERFAAQSEVDADINAMNDEAAMRARKEEKPL